MLREQAWLCALPGHLPEPRRQPVREAVLPGLPVSDQLALTAYRTPGTRADSKRATTSLTLLRYPVWAQALVLPWLPIMAVLFFFTVTRSEVLVCEPNACEIESHKGFSTRQDPVGDVRLAVDEDTKRPALVVQARGESRFDLGPDVAKVYDAYRESRRANTPLRVPLGGRAWWGMLGVILGLELLIVFAYAVNQRAITLEVANETGGVRILERKRGRTRELTTFDLGDVEEFDFLDLDEEATGRAVIAVMKRKEERRRLFDAVNLEAARGRDFLEEAREAWCTSAGVAIDH